MAGAFVVLEEVDILYGSSLYFFSEHWKGEGIGGNGPTYSQPYSSY